MDKRDSRLNKSWDSPPFRIMRGEVDAKLLHVSIRHNGKVLFYLPSYYKACFFCESETWYKSSHYMTPLKTKSAVEENGFHYEIGDVISAISPPDDTWLLCPRSYDVPKSLPYININEYPQFYDKVKNNCPISLDTNAKIQMFSDTSRASSYYPGLAGVAYNDSGTETSIMLGYASTQVSGEYRVVSANSSGTRTRYISQTIANLSSTYIKSRWFFYIGDNLYYAFYDTSIKKIYFYKCNSTSFSLIYTFTPRLTWSTYTAAPEWVVQDNIFYTSLFFSDGSMDLLWFNGSTCGTLTYSSGCNYNMGDTAFFFDGYIRFPYNQKRLSPNATILNAIETDSYDSEFQKFMSPLINKSSGRVIIRRTLSGTKAWYELRSSSPYELHIIEKIGNSYKYTNIKYKNTQTGSQYTPSETIGYINGFYYCTLYGASGYNMWPTLCPYNYINASSGNSSLAESKNMNGFFDTGNYLSNYAEMTSLSHYHDTADFLLYMCNTTATNNITINFEKIKYAYTPILTGSSNYFGLNLDSYLYIKIK